MSSQSQIGRPPQVPFGVLGTMIVVGVLLRKRSKSAQYAWWLSPNGCYRRWFDGIPFPGRSTFFDRYRKAAKRYEIVFLRNMRLCHLFADAVTFPMVRASRLGRMRRR
jgi:hypothetical protein